MIVILANGDSIFVPSRLPELHGEPGEWTHAQWKIWEAFYFQPPVEMPIPRECYE